MAQIGGESNQKNQTVQWSKVCIMLFCRSVWCCALTSHHYFCTAAECMTKFLLEDQQGIRTYPESTVDSSIKSGLGASHPKSFVAQCNNSYWTSSKQCESYIEKSSREPEAPWRLRFSDNKQATCPKGCTAAGLNDIQTFLSSSTMTCGSRTVFRCFKVLERLADRITGAAGPYFVGLAVILLGMGTICFCKSFIQQKTKKWHVIFRLPVDVIAPDLSYPIISLPICTLIALNLLMHYFYVCTVPPGFAEDPPQEPG